jgi:hypothetical protein
LSASPGKPQRISVWPGSSALRRIENAPQAVDIHAGANPHHASIA